MTVKCVHNTVVTETAAFTLLRYINCSLESLSIYYTQYIRKIVRILN